MTIQNWLQENQIKFETTSEDSYLINIPKFGLVLALMEQNSVFDEDMNLYLNEDEEEFKVDFYAFEFGDYWYYSKERKLKDFNVLKYIGEFNDTLGLGNIPMLGLHGGFDILNGSRSYKDWINKAKFLGVSTIGICKKNTLAGSLKFQLSCEDNRMNFIIGEDGSYKRADLPSGGTASLCFKERGVYKYKMESSMYLLLEYGEKQERTENRGTIVIQ